MELDYKSIGIRVKICRLKKNMSQEATAEKSSLTSQHISNIETANTKVGLPTLVSIANALSVSVDAFLSDNVLNSKNILTKEVAEIFDDCNNYEMRILLQILKSSKNAIQNCVELSEKFNSESE